MNESNELKEENQAPEPVQTADSYHSPKFNWKRSLITALIILVTAAVVGGVTWYLMDQNNKEINSANDKSIKELQNTIKELKDKAISESKENSDATEADWKVYKNTQYGFQLTFPESWKGYKFYPQTLGGSTITWYVELPTTDAVYAQADQTHEAGYASFFAISAYTKAQWSAIQAEELKPTYLGENANYTFAYSPAQAAPTDLTARFSDIKSITATFKAL